MGSAATNRPPSCRVLRFVHGDQARPITANRPDSVPFPRSFAPAALLILGLVVTSCDLSDPDVECTDNIVWGLNVTVLDSLTGTPAASGARLIARDGTFADTTSDPVGHVNPDSGTLLAAEERPGVYRVTVEKDGFLTWERTGVVVIMDDDDCHVVPVHLVARLRRGP